MASDALLSLRTLRCATETHDGGGSPYIWPVLVVIDDTTAQVYSNAPSLSEARIVLKDGIHGGDSAAIPPDVGSLFIRIEDDTKPHHIIVVVAMWQKNDTPDNAFNAGYQAYTTAVHDAIASNLLALNDPDPAGQQQTIDNIKTTIRNAVEQAISDNLSAYEKARIFAHLLTLDAPIDSSSAVFSSLAAVDFDIQFGGSLGGRLLFYRDNTQDGTGDVDTPSVIGLGGWADFKFLFSGGNGILYAVDQAGRLLFYRDNTQNGTGDVDTPSVIGLGGWADFKFLFSGGNGNLYAVDQAGRLLFYRDNTQNGTGDVDTPSVIGLGGWADFKFLFSGGNGIIYAVDPAGRLLFYRDNTQDGTGDVDTPSVIGLGGWADFKFLFSGGNGIIYAVDQAGRLLFYRDNTQNGTGDVDTPSVIGLGGWADFKFLFSGEGGILYAVEAAQQPPQHYEVDAAIQIVPVICEAELDAVHAATATVNSLEAQLHALQTEFAQAPASEKPEIHQEILELEQTQLTPAKAALAAAEQALQACRARSTTP